MGLRASHKFIQRSKGSSLEKSMSCGERHLLFAWRFETLNVQSSIRSWTACWFLKDVEKIGVSKLLRIHLPCCWTPWAMCPWANLRMLSQPWTVSQILLPFYGFSSQMSLVHACPIILQGGAQLWWPPYQIYPDLPENPTVIGVMLTS